MVNNKKKCETDCLCRSCCARRRAERAARTAEGAQQRALVEQQVAELRVELQRRHAAILQQNLAEGAAHDAIVQSRKPVGAMPGLGSWTKFLRGPLLVRGEIDMDPQELFFEEQAHGAK